MTETGLPWNEEAFVELVNLNDPTCCIPVVEYVANRVPLGKEKIKVEVGIVEKLLLVVFGLYGEHNAGKITILQRGLVKAAMPELAYDKGYMRSMPKLGGYICDVRTTPRFRFSTMLYRAEITYKIQEIALSWFNRRWYQCNCSHEWTFLGWFSYQSTVRKISLEPTLHPYVAAQRFAVRCIKCKLETDFVTSELCPECFSVMREADREQIADCSFHEVTCSSCDFHTKYQVRHII